MTFYSRASILLVLLLINTLSYSQQDDCGAGAENLPVNGACDNFLNDENGVEGSASSSCAPGGATLYSDIWYTITGNGNTINIDITGMNNPNSVLSVYTGCPGSFTSDIACTSITGAAGSVSFASTNGTTYFVRIQRVGGSNNANSDGQICVTDAPAGPANDDPCNATALTVGATCTFATFTNENATDSPGVPAPGCASYSGGDVWFTVTVPASGNVTLDMNTGVVTDAGMAIYSGTCGALTLIECDDDDSPNGLMSLIALTGQTPGATLWVRVWEFGNNNNGTFDICATDPGGGSGPANDDPCNATPLTVGATCTFATYTNENATASAGVPAPGCASYSGGDVWFTVTVPASGNVTVDMNTGVVTDAGMAIYSGTCGALTLIECDDDDSPNGLMSLIALTGQTPGATLWVRVWEFGNNNNGTFDICATDPGGGGGTPPANDDPCNATPIAVNATCTFATFTNADATASAGVPAPGCASYSGGDVWFTVTVPASGTVTVNTNTGVITDGGMAIYSGTCASLTLIECDDDDSNNGLMPQIDLFGQTPGATLWVRVWEFGNNNNGTFDICATEPPPTGPCGNPLTNDYCDAPAILTQGAGSWSSSTSGIYSSDAPANTNTLFCGSIENNSWYEFTALSTTEVFDFTSVTNCTSGIQAQVYDVTQDANGCCTNLASVSNCESPATATPFTITATTLTIGNTYILMVDGFGGDQCDFTVSNWTATGILPVELVQFNALALNDRNAIQWATASEKDNDYFVVQRSYDGINFDNLGTVSGQGNVVETTMYSFNDFETRVGISYYRLKQVDFNGEYTYSDIVTLNRSAQGSGILNAYPNPTRDLMNIEINKSDLDPGLLTITETTGRIVHREEITNLGFVNVKINLSGLAEGTYVVNYTDKNTNNSKLIQKK